MKQLNQLVRRFFEYNYTQDPDVIAREIEPLVKTAEVGNKYNSESIDRVVALLVNMLLKENQRKVDSKIELIELVNTIARSCLVLAMLFALCYGLFSLLLWARDTGNLLTVFVALVAISFVVLVVTSKLTNRSILTGKKIVSRTKEVNA